MNSQNQSPCTPLNCRGFGLVELMVALVITLILLAGIGNIFLGSKKSFNIQDSLGRMQENGRYAMDTLVADLRRSGYWGGNTDTTVIVGTTGTDTDTTGACTADNTDWIRMVNRRIFGKNNAVGTYACIPTIGANDYVRGDILVVRYAAPWKVGGITTPVFVNNRFYMRTSLFRGALFLGSAEADGLNDVSGAAVREAELVGHAYYIGNSATNCPTTGVAVPALFRRTMNDAGNLESEEIASGVDHLQLQYGVDEEITAANPRGDGTVNQYFDADDINDTDGADPAKPDWKQVIAARIWMLVRSECPETGYNNDNSYTMGDLTGIAEYTPDDGFRRQLYTSTVQLRNTNFQF